MCRSLVILVVLRVDISAFAYAGKKLYKLCCISYARIVLTFQSEKKLRHRKLRVGGFGAFGAFSVQRVNRKKLLCFNGKELLKTSALRDVIEKEFMHCKGVGARKLKYRLRQRFEGISEQRVQSVLSESKLNQMVNAKFRNKVIGRPIQTSAVQVSIL